MSGSPAESCTALVVGAGPAGLMAAEVLAERGHAPLVCEARPTPARKFLMAGKSGLNLTKDEAPAEFAARVSADWLRPILHDFGPDQVRAWAEALGQPLFTGSSGRVYPVGMKASPLLRAWLARLATAGARLRAGWRWTGVEPDGLSFATPEGARRLRPGVTVLALGGASWPRLGSDAAWVPLLAARGVQVAPFRPANMGFHVDWSPHMSGHFGQPVKGCALSAGGVTGRGEFVISSRGVEGSGIYAVSAAVRDGAALTVDLLPDLPQDEVARRLDRQRAGLTAAERLRRALGLDGARLALLLEWGRPLPSGAGALAALVKALPGRLGPPRPLDEAISSAGGIRRDSLSEELELRSWPGVFVAGEMIDWEAPTGGYLLTTCLATGRHAGLAAARRLDRA